MHAFHFLPKLFKPCTHTDKQKGHVSSVKQFIDEGVITLISLSKRQTALLPSLCTLKCFHFYLYSVPAMTYIDTIAHYGSRHTHELSNANCPKLC